MRRIALTFCVAATLALPVASAGAAEPPTLGVKVAACETGPESEERAAEFSGAMPAAPGASVLSMRFDLEQRRGAGWKPMTVPGFGRFERSAAGVAGFVYAKRVERLAAGASYRVKVRFRWADADGKVVKRATRSSAACRQPDVRPDLEVVSVDVEEAGSADRARYVVRVRNGGPGDLTDAFAIGLTVNGTGLGPQALAGLEPAALETVVFDGPRCAPGSTVTASADPGDAVAEPVEDDNALRVACPA